MNLILPSRTKDSIGVCPSIVRPLRLPVWTFHWDVCYVWRVTLISTLRGRGYLRDSRSSLYSRFRDPLF